MYKDSMYGLLKGTLDNLEDRNIISYFNKTLTNDKVMDKIDRLAYYLSSIGISKGDSVAICLPNIPDAVFSVYAVNKCGAIANLIHPLTPPLGLKKIIKDTASKLLIYLDTFFAKGKDVLSEINTIICNVSYDMAMPMRALAWLSTRKDNKLCLNNPNTTNIRDCYGEKGEVHVEIDSEDIAVYLHSGGTTGTPKTIMISNRSINACAIKTGALVGDITGNTDAMLMVLPLFHGFGLGVAMHTTICKGGKVVLMPRFSGREAAKLIRREKVTFMAGVPQMYNKIMDAPNFQGKHLKGLRNIYCGGDKLPKSIKDRWDCLMAKHGNNIEILEGYGLTEMLTVSHVNVPGASKPSSVGKPLEGILQRIVDEKGNTLKPNESGEIILSGDTMMSGYLKDKEATDKAIKEIDGRKWLFTGDCGYIDEDGFLFFRERIKRMVKVSGINVFPQEIEYTISTLEEIKYACALEIIWKGKSAIKLYVVLNKDYTMTDQLNDKILKFIGDRLMKYSVPRIIEVRDSLPLTQIGKVDYKTLCMEEAKKGKLVYK